MNMVIRKVNLVQQVTEGLQEVLKINSDGDPRGRHPLAYPKNYPHSIGHPPPSSIASSILPINVIVSANAPTIL